MKKVLIIAYHFPPIGGGGTQRTVKFVKYLSKFGWEPFVLTLKGNRNCPQDPSLLEDISDVKIYRTYTLEPIFLYYLLNKLHIGKIYQMVSRWFFVPDIAIGWFPFAYFAARKIITKQKIDLIYSTASPYSSHLIGLKLKEKTKLPWVADFRDEWTQNPFICYPTLIHKKMNQIIEKKVLNLADKIISVTEPITKELAKIVSNKCSRKFATITNGFDPEDFCNLEQKKKKFKMTIVYAGTLYGKQSPYYFLKAYQELIKEKKYFKKKIKLKFIGNIQKSLIRDFNKILENLYIKSYMPHSNLIYNLQNADVLLLIISKQRGEGTLTGKIFEYLAVKKPILALVPPNGVAADLIRKTGSGIVVDPEDIPSIKKAILDLYEQWQDNRLRIQPNLKEMNKYDRRKLTEELARAFNDIKL